MTEADHSEDRYRQLRDALEQLVHEDDFPDGPVERVELFCHASGEVSWRVWTPRAEEPIGGMLDAETSS